MASSPDEELVQACARVLAALDAEHADELALVPILREDILPRLQPGCNQIILASATSMLPRLVPLLSIKAAPRVALSHLILRTVQQLVTIGGADVVAGLDWAALMAPLSRLPPNENVLAAACDVVGSYISQEENHAGRRKCISLGLVVALSALIGHFESDSQVIFHVAQCAHAVLQLRKPPPDFEDTQALLPAAAALLGSTNEGTLTHALWVLAFLSQDSGGDTAAVLAAGVAPAMAAFVGGPVAAHRLPALRVLGNIVSCDEAFTEAALQTGFLAHLEALMVPDGDPVLHQEVAWAVSNVIAGSRAQAQRVIDQGALVSALAAHLTDETMKVRRECLYCFHNVMDLSAEQITQILAQVPGVCERILQLLADDDSKILELALEFFEKLLTTHDGAHVQALDSPTIHHLGWRVEELALSDTRKVASKAKKVNELIRPIF